MYFIMKSSLIFIKPEYLAELEKTMALLAFDDVHNSPVASLLDATQRQKTASELNAAILAAQSQDRHPKLPSLLKMLSWAQVILFKCHT